MTHESSCGYLSLCFGIICRASDKCSRYERASNSSAITRGFPKNHFSESTTLTNVCPSDFLLELPIVVACIHNINNLKLTMNNQGKATEPCPCCGSHLQETHVMGCQREHVQWIYANGRWIRQKNAALMMDLAVALDEKGIQN